MFLFVVSRDSWPATIVQSNRPSLP